MRKIIASAIAGAAVLMGSVTIAAPAVAAETPVTLETLTYTYDSANPAAGAVLTGAEMPVDTCEGEFASWAFCSGDIVVPSTISVDGLDIPVVRVGDGAFLFSDSKTYKGVYSLTFDAPSNVREIGRDAFGANRTHAALEIPSSVVTIEDGAFKDNESLTELTFQAPSALQSIGKDAFRGIGESGLVAGEVLHIDLPASLEVIGEGAFAYDGTSVTETSVTFPPDSKLKRIERNAFEQANIDKILLPASLEYVGPAAFKNNDGLALVAFLGSSLRTPAVTPADYETGSFGPGKGEGFTGTTVCYLPSQTASFTAPPNTRDSWYGYDTQRGITINYDPNYAGGGATFDEEYCVGFPITLPTLERFGWKQTMWSTDAAGNEPFADQTEAIEKLDEVTLYAQWELLPGYSQVSFDSRGGSAVEPVTVENGSTLTEPLPERAGFELVGWTRNAEEPGTRFDFETPVSESFTLYAVWERVKYTVEFDSAGGTPIAPVQVPAGSTVQQPANPARDGYTFVEWEVVIPAAAANSSTAGDTQGANHSRAFDFATPVESNLTLTAKWKTVPSAPSLSDTGGADFTPLAVLGGFVLLAAAVVGGLDTMRQRARG